MDRHDWYGPENEHTAKWEDGRREDFPPYCGYGRSSFIKAGLQRGKVTYGGREVVWNEEYDQWQFKDDPKREA